MSKPTSEKIQKDKNQLRNYFIKNIRLGDVLSKIDLKKYVKKNKLNVGDKFIANLKKNVLATALHMPLKPITKYQTMTIPKLGMLSIDFAFFKKKKNGKRN